HGAMSVNCVPFLLSGKLDKRNGDCKHEHDRWNLGTDVLPATAPILVAESRRQTASRRLGCRRCSCSAGTGPRGFRTLSTTSGGLVHGGGSSPAAIGQDL